MVKKEMILRNDFLIPTPPPKSFPKVGVIKIILPTQTLGHYHYTLSIYIYFEQTQEKLPCHAVSLFWLMVIESCLGALNL